MDLHQAYNQIPINPEDIQNTAVITHFGLSEYNVMTFDLRNAGQTFQRYFFQVLGDLDYVFTYIDDILIDSSSPAEHELHLREVLERLKKFRLRVNLDKCLFGKSELEFLSYFVNSEGNCPTPEKVKAIIEVPRPETIVELRRFLGLANFYRRNIRHAA